MIVTPSTLPIDFLKSDLVRSPGLHASDIYGDLFRKLEPKRYTDEPMNGPLVALGSAWERYFEMLLEVNDIIAYRPKEMISPEGIAFSPDLIINATPRRVGEIKLTSMSLDDIPDDTTNNLPEKFDKYLVQMKLYAHWLGLTHGWLAILSIRKPYAPEFRAFNLGFTAAELQDNYTMIMNHARHEGMLK